MAVLGHHNQVTGANNTIFLLKTVRLHPIDKPWMTTSMKQLIKDLQSAFHRGETTQWQRLKSKVQSEIEYRKKEFYKNKIKHLRKDDYRLYFATNFRILQCFMSHGRNRL